MADRVYAAEFEPLRPDAAAMLSRKTGIDFTRTDFSNEELWFCCTVRNLFGTPVCVIVFEFKTPFDAHFSVAISDMRALTRRLITVLYRAVFTRASRITALIDPDNKRALKQVWRMGFQYEGILRRGINGNRDAVLWGLLPEDCPYLQGKAFTFRTVRVMHEPVMTIQ